jgi:dihydroneopterin aldolase/2-amino-4-hydroxy-6-hydroxymethyldihydropteridine diphosphokinase
VRAVDVAVHKPGAPLDVPFADVVVRIRRDRSKLPAAEPYLPGASHAADDDEPPVPVPTGAAVPGLAPEDEAADPSRETVPTPVAPMPDGLPLPVPDLLPVPGPESLPVPELAPDVPPGPPSTPPSTPAAAPPASAAVPAPERPEPVTGSAPDLADGLDVAPREPVAVVLALGANLGPAQQTLRDAVAELSALAGLEVTAVGPLARSAAVGVPDQPDFVNTVVLGRTTLSPRGLLHALRDIEVAHGRRRVERWGPRTLDIDIVTYGSTTASSDDLEIPHPRAGERAFVLVPWAHADPDAVLPGLGGGPVALLADTAPDRTGIRWLALDWLTEPAPGVPGVESAPVPGVESAPVPGTVFTPEPFPPFPAAPGAAGEAPAPAPAPMRWPDRHADGDGQSPAR